MARVHSCAAAFRPTDREHSLRHAHTNPHSYSPSPRAAMSSGWNQAPREHALTRWHHKQNASSVERRVEKKCVKSKRPGSPERSSARFTISANGRVREVVFESPKRWGQKRSHTQDERERGEKSAGIGQNTLVKMLPEQTTPFSDFQAHRRLPVGKPSPTHGGRGQAETLEDGPWHRRVRGGLDVRRGPHGGVRRKSRRVSPHPKRVPKIIAETGNFKYRRDLPSLGLFGEFVPHTNAGL